ncbi:hypothetical protein D3C84_1026630 [compost metagenome]
MPPPVHFIRLTVPGRKARILACSTADGAVSPIQQHLIAVAFVVDREREVGYPRDPGVDRAIAMQAQPAVAGSLLTDLEVLTAGLELNAGGG